MISLPAGLAHMGHWRFLIFTVAGAGVWNAALIKGGSWLSRYFEEAQGWLNWIVVGSIALALIAYLWRVATWKPRG
jgi:membrane protein DedA with SNARE-associated domain